MNDSMGNSRQIKLGAIISYGTICFSMIAGLIYTPWMVRQIGKSDYGLFVLATSFLAYFVMDFGLGQAIARFIAKYRAEGEEQKINGLIGLTTKLYLLIDLFILIVLVIVFFFIEHIFIKLNAIEIHRFKVVYCIAGLFSLLSFPFTPLNGILIAYERFVLLKVCELLNKMGIISLMIIALLMGYKLYAIVAINAFVGIIIIILKLVYLSNTSHIRIVFKGSGRALLKQLVSFSIWITVIGIAQRLLMNITPSILGILSGTEQIAVFSIGMIIEGYVWTFANALNGLFLPRISELAMNNERMGEINRLMIRVGRLQLFVVGVLLVGIISLGKQFIVLWMGKDFQKSYYVALLLILPGVVTLTQEIGYTFLFVANKLKYRAWLFLVASGISVIISIILAPSLGAVGSAIGIFIALILCHVIGMNIIYRKILKLDILIFFRECHLKMLLPFALSILAGFIIQVYVPALNLPGFFAKASILGIAYVTLMWSMGLNNEERSLFRSLATMGTIKSSN